MPNPLTFSFNINELISYNETPLYFDYNSSGIPDGNIQLQYSNNSNKNTLSFYISLKNLSGYFNVKNYKNDKLFVTDAKSNINIKLIQSSSIDVSNPGIIILGIAGYPYIGQLIINELSNNKVIYNSIDKYVTFTNGELNGEGGDITIATFGNAAFGNAAFSAGAATAALLGAQCKAADATAGGFSAFNGTLAAWVDLGSNNPLNNSILNRINAPVPTGELATGSASGATHHAAINSGLDLISAGTAARLAAKAVDLIAGFINITDDGFASGTVTGSAATVVASIAGAAATTAALGIGCTDLDSVGAGVSAFWGALASIGAIRGDFSTNKSILNTGINKRLIDIASGSAAGATHHTVKIAGFGDNLAFLAAGIAAQATKLAGGAVTFGGG